MNDSELAAHWKVPACLPAVHPALTDAMVSDAQTQFGVTLPPLYLAMLRVQNGGYLRGNWPTHHTNGLYGIGQGVWSITEDGAWWRPKNAEPGSWVPPGAEWLVPFDGDGHTDLCFDYRACGPAGEPSIAFIDLECRRESELTDSFATYLRGLVDDRDYLRLYGVEAGDAARRIAAHAQVRPPSLGGSYQGYETWHLTLSGELGWQLWLLPNRVPAGIRREGELTVATEETALRFPEDPACTATVGSTRDDREALRALIVAALGEKSLGA